MSTMNVYILQKARKKRLLCGTETKVYYFFSSLSTSHVLGLRNFDAPPIV